MTGRELICYILTNHLEDERICKDGHILGFETAEDTAKRLNVGVATIKTWYKLNFIDGVEFDGKVYILNNAQPKK